MTTTQTVEMADHTENDGSAVDVSEKIPESNKSTDISQLIPSSPISTTPIPTITKPRSHNILLSQLLHLLRSSPATTKKFVKALIAFLQRTRKWIWLKILILASVDWSLIAAVDWVDRGCNAWWCWGLERVLGFPTGYRVHEGGGVVVTGASSGIGAHAAITLAEQNYTVFAAVRRIEDAHRLRRQTPTASHRIIPVLLDVTSQAQLTTALTFVRQSLSSGIADGKLVAIVNCAGIPCVSPIEAVSDSDMLRCFDVNVCGGVRVTKEFLPLLRECGGRIVNVSSVSGFTASPMNGIYAASKMAVEAVSDSLRVEVQRWGISVSLIEPGSIDTKLWSKCSRPAPTPPPSQQPHLPPLYEPLQTSVKSITNETRQHLISPKHTSRAILHAIRDEYPKTRYLVGFDARVAAFMRGWVPDRLLDWGFWVAMGAGKEQDEQR